MFNTYIPVVKPPTFGASERDVADLADRIRGAVAPAQTGVPQLPVEGPLVQGVIRQVRPAAPQANIFVTQWEPLV